MIYRFFVAVVFTFAVFPFAVMYTFAAAYPEAHFAFDRQTWLQGLAPIAFGWVLFLLPGLLPFVGHRYYGWVARKTGFSALYESIRKGLGRTRDGVKWLNLKRQTVSIKRPETKNWATNIRQGLQRMKRNSTPTDGMAAAQSDVPAVSNDAATKSPTKVSQSLQKARGVLHDAPKHVANVRQTFETLKHRLTPDDFQRTIDLNQYTLETFSHAKGIIRELLSAAVLSDFDREFCNAVVAAVPEPPSPSATEKPLPVYSFNYPQEHRDELKHHAANAKVLLRDLDFEAAERGDLERALLIVRSVVARETRDRAVVVDPSSEDLMVGLPLPSSA